MGGGGKVSKLSVVKSRGLTIVSICLFTLLLALVFEALTLIGAPNASVFDPSAWGRKRILVVWFVFLVIYGVFRYFGIFAMLHNWAVALWRDRRVRAWRIVYFVCGFIFFGSIGVSVVGLLSLLGLCELTIALSFFCFSLGSCLFLVYANRKYVATSPERVFVPVGITLGVLIAVLTPVQTSVSADDHIHYDHTLALSYLSSPEYTESDMKLLNPPHIEGGNYSHWSFSEQEYLSVLGDLNADGEEYALSIDGFSSLMGNPTLQYSSLGYIPGAVGLWLGRLAGIPFVAVFLLGRISSILFFFTLVYFGVRKLKSQRVLVLSFSMLPAVLFVASNYSYDIWVVGWLLFGFLKYLSWLQNPEQKLSAKDVLIVALSFVIGLGPKAIYFPIFFLLLFVPKSKFPSQIFAVRYRIAVLGFAILILGSFLLPFVMQGSGGNDVRGGTDVNSSQQISFILSNPLGYVEVLVNFLSGYLSIANSETYTNFFAYLGFSSLDSLPLVFLILIAITDSGVSNYPYALWRYRGAAFALLYGTSALMASALYVSYTAVGSNTVAGCQGRYLLPLLVPFLALFFNSKIRNENSRKWYNLLVLIVTVGFVFICVFELSMKVYAG